MTLYKILKRRDAASLIIAIVVAMIVSQSLASATFHPTMLVADAITGSSGDAGMGYQSTAEQYVQPLFWALFQLALLEAGAWVFTALRGSTRKKK